ncbi:hypothetical protein J6590_011032 [Homalodisca vitripennis]|nr:hypothetical protein J6590_011032 [Homalodisca vitripennis]
MLRDASANRWLWHSAERTDNVYNGYFLVNNGVTTLMNFAVIVRKRRHIGPMIQKQTYRQSRLVRCMLEGLT